MLKSQGKIVVFDRFPLKEFWNMDEPMDGPRVGDSSRWKNLECKFYNEIGYPDHIFVLKVNGKASVERKQEHGNGIKQQQIKKKIMAANEALKYLLSKGEFCPQRTMLFASNTSNPCFFR